MFAESAELYDVIYGAFKDYTAESQRIASLIGTANPEARTILDVGWSGRCSFDDWTSAMMLPNPPLHAAEHLGRFALSVACR